MGSINGAGSAPLPPAYGAGNATAPAPYTPAVVPGVGGAPVTGLNTTSIGNLQTAHVPEPVIALADSITANMRAGTQVVEATDIQMPQVNLPSGQQVETAGNQLSPSVINGTMDPDYPALSARHVYILRALGVPESSLATAASYNPTAVEVEQYVQAIIADPDSLDVSLGRDTGTTRQLLQQIPPQILANPNPDAYPQVEEPTAPVDTNDQQYPALSSEQVQILRAVGFPEQYIAEFASTDPNVAEVQQRINEYIADPEALDRLLGNPEGTARNGLTALGITPGGEPAGGFDWVKTGLIVAGVAAAAFIGWKLLHKKPPVPTVGGPGGGGQLADGTLTVLGGRMGSDGPYAINLLGLAQAGIDNSAFVSGLMAESKNTALINGLKDLGFAAKAVLPG